MIRFYLKITLILQISVRLWLSMAKIETDCQLRKLRILCSYFSSAFIVARGTLLFKMVISIFKTKNLNFYISDNFLHSNALGECFKISKRNPSQSKCRNSTYLKELEKVFKYWVTQKSKSSYTLCSTFPGITCCTGFKLRMHNFYSNGISTDICWKDIFISGTVVYRIHTRLVQVLFYADIQTKEI